MSAARPPRLLLAAGLLTWAVIASGWAFSLREAWTPARSGAAALWVGFAAAFYGAAGTRARMGARRALLALETACVLGLTALGHGSLAGVLLAVIAGQAPFLLPLPLAASFIAAQSATFGALLALHVSPASAVFTGLGFAAFQLFALGAAHLARREAQGRAELARVHAELLATQSLLADGARAAERLRISRELHDAIGHHLTALSLQLEVARNTAPGNAAVERAQGIARAMLKEVREVVSALRSERPVDLPRALSALVAGIPHPRVHLSVADGLEVRDAAAAHAAFRCVQEAVTNAVRHARADNLWIDVRGEPGALQVEVRDDGRGAGAEPEGRYGLVGLTERLAELGGAVRIDPAPGGGVRLRATVPLREVPA